MNHEIFPPIHRLRWKGWGRWHRFHIGPFAYSFYVPSRTPGRCDTWYFGGHTWRYRRGDTYYHTRTFRGMLRARRQPQSKETP